MNQNAIFTECFSNPESEELYNDGWSDEPEVSVYYEIGFLCGGCNHYASFNENYGLCKNELSRHYLETIIKDFTCGEVSPVEFNAMQEQEKEGEG